MSVVRKKVLWYPGAETDVEGIALTDATSITVRKGMNSRSNTVDVKLKNPISSYDGTYVIHKHVDPTTKGLRFKQSDVIEVYAKHAGDQADVSTTDSTYLLTTADVIEFKGKLDSKNTGITIKAADKTFNILNKLWSQAYTESLSLNSPLIIQNVIRSVSSTAESKHNGGYLADGSYSQDAGVYEIDARLVSEGGFIQDTRPDGSAYPTISIGKLFKPVYEWVEEMSQVEYTNTQTEIDEYTNPCKRKHNFYIDRLNRAHWEYPDSTPDYTITYGTVNDDGVSMSADLTYATFDVVNTVFFNAGKDLDNVSVLGFFFDSTTEEPKLKIKYIPYTNIAQNYRQMEVQEGNISINADGTVNIINSSDVTSWGESYSSESDYKEKFFNKCVYDATASARNFTKLRGSPRWKGTLTFKGVDYGAGELITVTAPQIGVWAVPLRIQTVTHQITNQAWTTTLDVEQDEKEV